MPSVHYDCIQDIVWDKQESNQYKLNSCIDICRISISSNLQLIGRFHTVLSEDERARAARYHQEKDRQRFIISRGALRFLLAGYSANLPEKIKFIEGANKKPFIQNDGAPDLHYNVSHSGDWILIAISDSDVGTDIEKIDDDFSYKEILPQNFSSEEIHFINDGGHKAENFYLLWTRKEALLKATSKGIDNDLPLVPCLNGLHAISAEAIGSDTNWRVRSFKVAEKYIGSIAHQVTEQSIRFLDMELAFFKH